MGAKFKCVSCGLCCHDLKSRFKDRYDQLGEDYKFAVDRFPYEMKDGPCEKLGEDGKCTVYEDRPLLCDVKSFYNLNKEKINLPRKEFYAILNLSCIDMMKNKGKIEQLNELLQKY